MSNFTTFDSVQLDVLDSGSGRIFVSHKVANGMMCLFQLDSVDVCHSQRKPTNLLAFRILHRHFPISITLSFVVRPQQTEQLEYLENGLT